MCSYLFFEKNEKFRFGVFKVANVSPMRIFRRLIFQFGSYQFQEFLVFLFQSGVFVFRILFHFVSPCREAPDNRGMAILLIIMRFVKFPRILRSCNPRY